MMSGTSNIANMIAMTPRLSPASGADATVPDAL
jgi:hypothetical protein